MKRILSLTILLLVSFMTAKAQVFIINDNMRDNRHSEIRVAVVDSLTGDPVSFASVYVIPAKDTTITNFTLSDAEGKAKLEEVPHGNYVIHIEMLGYKPFLKEQYLRERVVELGTVKLKVDEHYLSAATVTDVGNPIVVKQDTVEFNASSFRVGANAMLKDLLNKMPGMEITDDGKVKFNGEEIDQITIGGRTFFFNDQATALNNLPASIVDKVRVIDRESEATRSTGLQDNSREKILDVGLKKEYERGWFGNAGVNGGAAVPSDKDNPLRGGRDALYSGNVLASAYTEKDQLTVVGNLLNFNEDTGGVTMISMDGESMEVNQGISSAAQIGVNANTSRIKGVETTVGGSYKYSDTQTGTQTLRTTHQDDGDILSSKDNSGRVYSNSYSSNMEFKKEKGNVRFHLRPNLSREKSISHSYGTSETSYLGATANSSESYVFSSGTTDHAGGAGDITFREVGGKKNRVIGMSFYGVYSGNDSRSTENSSLTMTGGADVRKMDYSENGSSLMTTGSLRYAEPIGEHLTLSVSGTLQYGRGSRIRDAFDAGGRNDYYSSESKSLNVAQRYDFTAQYKFKEQTWVTLGAALNGNLTETYSKSYNISDTTGVGDWMWFVTPTLRFSHTVGNDRFSVNASGYTSQPAAARMLPTMNIADPSRPTIGNIYLRPYSYTYLYGSWNRNNREKFSTLMVYFTGNLNFKPMTYARWFDSDGILYSIPVNSKKPTYTLNGSASYTTPLEAKKKWFMTIGTAMSFSGSTSYQAKSTLAGLDKDAFDYSAFMESFWGDERGDIFYSGKSGFDESSTRSITPSGNVSVKYTEGAFYARAFSRVSGRIIRYSLNPDINMNTMDTRLGAELSYTTKKEWEFRTDLNYLMYKGYPSGYGKPEMQWNAEISKNIGAFNLSFKAKDILDQTRNFRHTVTSNFEEDTYRLILGRYILFGVKWNFGKMSAIHSQRASEAAWDLAF